jgi:hypothetical protein
MLSGFVSSLFHRLVRGTVSSAGVVLAGRVTRMAAAAAGCLVVFSLVGSATAMALDSTPTPGIEPNGPVWAIAPTTHAIYIGGAFTEIDGKSRRHIAALDPETGALKAWNPGANGPVYHIAAAPSAIYASGSFTSIGGRDRRILAALRPSDGVATPWNPKPTRGPDGVGVSALAVTGLRLYVGGWWGSIGGKARPYLAALSRSTGAATAWKPDPKIDSTDAFPMPEIFDLRVSGSTVYVGGYFDHVGGKNRHLIAALNATTGDATPWNPHPDGVFTGQPPYFDRHHPPYVASIRVSGSTVYAGGYFNRMGGAPRISIAAVDSATGAATSWNPHPQFPDNDVGARVYELLVSGQTVYASGIFDQIGGQPRNRLAGLDRATGTANGWDPGPDRGPSALAHGPDGSVWAGGAFTGFATSPSEAYLARFEP